MSDGPIDRGGTWPPVVELTLARLRELRREPEAIFWSFVFPILISIALAAAFPSKAGRPVLVGVEQGTAGDALARTLGVAPGVQLRRLARPDLERAMRQGRLHVIVEPGTPPTYRYDPAREESQVARLVVDGILQRAAGRREVFTAADVPETVPGSRYVDWLIPGLIAMNVMGGGMWGIGFSIVQTRMRRLLKRLRASPMRRREYLAAHLLARLLFLVPEVALPLLFGAWVLGLPIRGGVGTIALVSLVGALAFGGLGLLAASRVRTFEAISGLLNVMMVPMWVLSGVFFSSANFPDTIQPFIQVLPLTALVDAMRAAVLDGDGLVQLAPQLGVLGAWAAASSGLALAIFRWQ